MQEALIPKELRTYQEQLANLKIGEIEPIEAEKRLHWANEISKFHKKNPGKKIQIRTDRVTQEVKMIRTK